MPGLLRRTQRAGGNPVHPYDAGIAATAASPASGRRTFPTFEGIRALAAVAIVVFHAGTYTGLTWNAQAGDHGISGWIRHLDVGVTVFFVLSAFLLYRPFVAAHLRAGPRPDPRSYLVRRVTRIFPAYWLALTVGMFVFGYSAELDLWGKFRLYGLIQIYWQDTLLAGLPQAWSLNTEITFYLFLPVWAALLRRLGRSRNDAVRVQYLGCLALYLISLAFRAWLRWDGRDLGYTWLPAQLDAFALGMALAVASAAGAARLTTRNRQRRPDGAPGLIGQLADRPAVAVTGAVVAYGGVVLLDMPLGFDRPSVAQEVAHQMLFGLVAALVVIPGAFGRGDRLWHRLLASRPLHALGLVSYGLYLWHITTLYEIDRRWWPEGPVASASVITTLWLALLATVAASVVAAFSWWVVERPLMEQARRVHSGRPRRPRPPRTPTDVVRR